MAAIFLEGPIGVGKSTLGRGLADRLGAVFVEGDDFLRADRPWFASSLRVCRGVADAIRAAHAAGKPGVGAFPLRCIEWLWYRRTLGEAGIPTLFVSLHARFESIVAPGRGRPLADWEKARTAEMIAEGYGARAFADLRLATDETDLKTTLDRLEQTLRKRLVGGDGLEPPTLSV